MKKYISKITVSMLAAFAFTSCTQEKLVYDESTATPLAAFIVNTGQLPVLEDEVSTTKIEIEISTKSKADRIVSYEIVADGTTATPNQYTIDGPVIIPANSYKGEIKVTGHFSELDANKYTLRLKLTDIQGGAHIEPTNQFFDLTIFKSCPFVGGDITTLTFTGSSYTKTFDPSNFVLDFTPTITATADPRVFAFDTLWGQDYVGTYTQNPSYNGQYVYQGTIKIKADLTLEISGMPSDTWATGGTGTYDPCTHTFTYYLNQELFTDTSIVPVIVKAN